LTTEDGRIVADVAENRSKKKESRKRQQKLVLNQKDSREKKERAIDEGGAA